MTHSPQSPSLVAPVSLLSTLKAIEDGTLTPTQSVRACLERIEQCEPIIKAFASRNDQIEALVEKASGPLHGIGLVVKDVLDSCDLPTEHNSPIYRGHRPHRDASILALARQAGCVLLGKSVTTEFAFLQPADTRNPHNPEYTPGGSSSGSAAAIAAGMAHLAIGTQAGGSIIRPAAFCGVTGYKPSAGLLPKVGIKDASWSLDTVGLFAATIADVAYATSVLSRRNLQIRTDARFDLPKLGFVRGHTWQDADLEYRNRFEDLLGSLKHFGVEIREIPLSDEYIAAFHAQQIIHGFEMRQALAWEYATHPDLLSPLLRQTLDFAETITPSDYDEARIAAETASKEIDEYFEDVDALISLSTTGPAPYGIVTTGSSIYNRIWTLFGLPAINVPGLVSESGLPLGVQIIGPYMKDQNTLQIAHWVEGAISRHLDR